MSRKKLSPLVEAMSLYSSLDERDRTTLADWIKSQTPKKQRAKSPAKKKPAEIVLPEKVNAASGD